MASFFKSFGKVSLYIVIFILILLVALYIFLNAILDLVCKEGHSLRHGRAGQRRHGAFLSEYEGVGFVWINAVAIKVLSGHMAMTQHNVFQIERNFFLTVKKIILSVENLAKREVMLTIKDAVPSRRSRRRGASGA